MKLNNIKDLNIESDILPLFNYSLNDITKHKILEILKKPLESKKQIENVQQILKGFVSNYNILKDYSYKFLDFHEVYLFLNNESIDDLSKKRLKYKLFYSKRKKREYNNQFSQLVLFLNKLYYNYFSKVDSKLFPREYSLILNRINTFFLSFELSKYEKYAKSNQFRDKDIINLSVTINSLKSNKRISLFWNDFFQFETYLSICKGIEKNKMTFPNIVEKRIKLSDLYHPLVKEPIKNNFETYSNVIVLNGPNMSGKSTFLKSIGLCVYLTHLGFAIPASYGEIPLYNNFSIGINSRDDINNGYSHFMTEVLSLKNVIENSSNGKNCFAVFDELFNGTNFEDALVICKKTINGLSQFKNSLFLISTHIQELKSETNEGISNYYIDCKLIDNKPTFTYKLEKGWSDIKIGRILFESEGLNKMLEKAYNNA